MHKTQSKEIMEITGSHEEDRKAYNYSMTLYLPLGEDMSESFNLENAVCNHGFFMMAPNVWIPSTKTLQRPLRLADSCTSILTFISHPSNENSIHVRLHDTEYVSPKDQQVILEQVGRMLRLCDRDERDVKQFHQLYPKAKRTCFGRIFRSPSIFEDMVKSILLCNCTWRRTLDMAQALCELQLELKGPKRGHGRTVDSTNMSKTKKSVDEDDLVKNYSLGNFPNSMELNISDEETLRCRCNLGYRAKIIIELVKSFQNGEVQLNKFEKALPLDAKSISKIYEMLNKKRGFGPFACANVLMCIGYYERIPTDTETFRHLKEIHGRDKVTNKDVKEIYDKYAPFQCMAYWFELCEYYQHKFGKLSELPRSKYHTVSGSYKY